MNNNIYGSPLVHVIKRLPNISIVEYLGEKTCTECKSKYDYYAGHCSIQDNLCLDCWSKISKELGL